MLNVKNTMTDSLSSTVNNWFNRAYNTGSQVAGRAVKEIGKVPAYMQGDVRVAATVILAANSAFFKLTNTFANWVDGRIENQPTELDADQKKFKNFLVNGVVVGGSTYIFNVVLSKLTQYQLSSTVLIAISAAAIAARILLNRKPTEETIDQLKDEANDVNGEAVQQKEQTAAEESEADGSIAVDDAAVAVKSEEAAVEEAPVNDAADAVKSDVVVDDADAPKKN